jgi:hypothetical protein
MALKSRPGLMLGVCLALVVLISYCVLALLVDTRIARR